MGRNNVRSDGNAEPSAPESQPLKDDRPQNPNAGGTVELKKELGLMNGVGIIVGVIIGAGIFVSPVGVIQYSGSTGLALIVWAMSGLLSMVGALCYAELGTMIPKSGGDYTYIMDSLGALPAFLYLWVALMIIVPTGNAILALTFSQYILQPFWPECVPPDAAVRLLSAVVIALLTAVNCYNVKWSARLQDLFTSMKILALVIIVIAGLVVLCMGTTDNLAEPFEGTTTEPGNIAKAFYSGLFTYAGWNYLNFVTEEIKNPFKNLPRAIWISMPVVTIAYTLANVAYFVVLTKVEILNSNAVAVTFGDKLLGVMSWIMPVFVACSTFGALNASIYAPSRLVFVGAREGHLPRALALINVETCTPIPALIFLGLLSIFMLISKDVQALIDYLSFVEASFWGMSIAGLLWLRYKRPDLERPIKVSLVLPILFLLVIIFLIVVSVIENQDSIGIALIIVASGIPVYYIFIYWENKPQFLKRLGEQMYRTSAIFFKGVLADSHQE
ncbi:unnamed protein product [Allacma fusca]|uniref:Amino acid transporter n=1 Tax=Allacma fusca TaxID=39272 RepID=A0A8J2PKI5_9HEXA|nr:unnamed protein product [Allacma fusca]